jgi:hypothetical protein
MFPHDVAQGAPGIALIAARLAATTTARDNPDALERGLLKSR